MAKKEEQSTLFIYKDQFHDQDCADVMFSMNLYNACS